MITICVKYLHHICHIRNENFNWIRVDTIYDQIKNVPLLNIIHIRNIYLCETQHEITTKRPYEISTVNT